MDKMQTFYDQLLVQEHDRDTYLESLSRLTEMQPEQLDSLESGREWSDWTESSG